MIDERLGKPSSSGAEALMLCPAKWRMERECKIPEQIRADATRGTAIHLAIESGDGAGLDDEALEQARRLAALEKEIVDAWLQSIGAESVEEIVRERRYWMLRGGEKVFSGKPDGVFRVGNHYLVTDFKSGRGEYKPAEDNVQLHCNAVLVMETAINLHARCESVRVALIQDMAKPPYTVADLSVPFLHAMQQDIEWLLKEIETAKIPIAGVTQCQFCKAYGVCPAVRTGLITRLQEAPLEVVPSGMELAAYAYIEKLIGERRRLAKLALSAGIEIEGWELGKPRRSVGVTDPTAAFNALKDHLEPEEFAGCCKVSVPQLASAFAHAKNVNAKAARKAIEVTLQDAGVLTVSEGEPSLKQKGGAE